MAYYTATVKATIIGTPTVVGMTEQSMNSLIAPMTLDASKLDTEGFYSKEYNDCTSEVESETISLEVHHFFKVELKLQHIKADDISEVPAEIMTYLQRNKNQSKVEYDVEIVSIVKED